MVTLLSRRSVSWPQDNSVHPHSARCCSLFFFFFFLSQSVLTHAISLEYIHYAVGKREKLAHKHVGM